MGSACTFAPSCSRSAWQGQVRGPTSPRAPVQGRRQRPSYPRKRSSGARGSPMGRRLQAPPLPNRVVHSSPGLSEVATPNPPPCGQAQAHRAGVPSLRSLSS